MLTNWCRFHNTAHPKTQCIQCLTVLDNKQIASKVTPKGMSSLKIDKSEISGEIKKPEEKETSLNCGEYPEVGRCKVDSKVGKYPTLREDEVWSLKFDGSKSKQGIGIGVELTNPKGKAFLAAYKLQFQCTHNIMEYEELIHGLLLAIKKGV